MSVRYHHDLYPRTAPKDGTRVRRFSKLQLLHAEGQRNGTGAGKVGLRGSDAEAQDIDPRGLQYVRVVRENTAVNDGATLSGHDEAVIHGYWFEQGDFLALGRKQKKLLTFGGAGTLAYLDRARMAPHTYVGAAGALAAVSGGQDPFDDQWRLYNQGLHSGGNKLGAVLWRVIAEAQSYQAGAYTHKHGDGETYTDTHDDDRTATAIPDLVPTFTATTDSSGNAWSVSAGEFTAQVGESVYDVVQRLMDAGLYVEMDPDTFELNAWEVANHGRDRTGLAWGTDVIRFNPPPDENRANGNILNDLRRAVRAIYTRTSVWAGGQDTYGYAAAAGDVLWEGFLPSDTSDTDALDALAARDITRRNDAGDTVQVRIEVGNDPANGYYLPGEHILPDDLATLHSGSGTWDWNESSYPVAAWSVTSRRSGAPDAYVHLGATYHATSDSKFQSGSGVGRHTHPPNPRLCDPAIDGGTASCSLDPAAMTAIPTPNGDFESGDNTNWADFGEGLGGVPNGNVQAGDPYNAGGGYYASITTLSPQWAYFGWGSTQFNAGQTYVVRGHANASSWIHFGDMAGGDFESVQPSGITGQFCIAWTPSANRTAVRLVQNHNSAGPTPGGGSGELIIDNVQAYTGGTGLNVLNGRATCAARGDHQHHWHSTSAPTASDDETRGFRVGTRWAQLDDLDAPTEILAVWEAVDVSEGAAVWLAMPDETGSGGGGGIEIDVTAAPYSASGDGSTDDTSAIQDAIDALNAAGGGTLYFPAGTYKITSTLSMTGRNYKLLGAGSAYGPSRIHMATANTTALSFATGSPTNLRTKTSLVRNLVISGPGGASSGRGIDATNDIHIEDCFVYGFYDGVYLRSESFYSHIYGSTFTDCDHAGVVLDDCNNTTIDTCRFTGAFGGSSAPIGAMQYGVYIGSTFPRGLGHRIVNCSIEYFTEDGVYASGWFSGELIGTYFESQQSGTGNAHVNLGPVNAAKALNIEGNYFQGDGTSGFAAIRGTSSERITVANNYFGVNAAIGIEAAGAGNSKWLLMNNYNSPAGTFNLPSGSYTLNPDSPPLSSGDAAGGDLSGTYPNPTVQDDSHSHTSATLPSFSGGELLISDSPSSPLVFADLLQNEAQDDLIYSG